MGDGIQFKEPWFAFLPTEIYSQRDLMLQQGTSPGVATTLELEFLSLPR
jgi:hypothetical protein